MIAQAMEKAIRISSDPRRRQSHQRTDPGRLALQGNFVKQGAVHIGVEVRIVLDEVASGLDGHYLRRTFHSQAKRQTHRNHGSHIDVLCVRVETRAGNGQVVRIKRNVGNGEFSRCVGRCASLKLTDRIQNLDGGVWNHGAGGIDNRASHRSRTSSRLSVSGWIYDKKEQKSDNRRNQRLLRRSQHEFLPKDEKTESDQRSKDAVANLDRPLRLSESRSRLREGDERRERMQSGVAWLERAHQRQ